MIFLIDCGITRPVKIYTTPHNYIDDVSLVSYVEGTNASIQYEISTCGEGKVKIELFDKEENCVCFL